MPGLVWSGLAVPGLAWSCPCWAWPGLPGLAWPGLAGPGLVCLALAYCTFSLHKCVVVCNNFKFYKTGLPGLALPGLALPGLAWLFLVWPGLALPGLALPCLAWPDCLAGLALAYCTFSLSQNVL